MISSIDHLGRTVLIPDNPTRIISLVPSQTELLHYLGLEERVVGVTKFCVHPENWRKSKTIIGGTKILKFNVIDSLQPDLIIANKEENTQEDIERLSENYPVWVSDVNNLDDALKMIQDVGTITQTSVLAKELSTQIAHSFSSLSAVNKKRVLYLIWRKPYMCAGRDTFVNDMLQRCGFENVMSNGRYPELKSEDFELLAPEVILFSSEPFPFKEHHLGHFHKLIPDAKLQLVDGEPFSWYGSRLMHSVSYFKKLQEVLEKS